MTALRSSCGNIMFKYPRTQHIRGSRFQHGDHDLEAVPWEDLAGKNLVIEEKMDGSNCGISFTPEGELQLQSRGHYLRGGPREKHFALLKQWASAKQDTFFKVLGSRYVMYGEWLFAKHTMFYDALPHYFMEFDVLDTENGVFLDTLKRDALLGNLVEPVKVLSIGKFKKLKELQDLIGDSYFITQDWETNLREAAHAAGERYDFVASHTDTGTRMEGLYVKWEEDGVVKGRYKYVRQSFTNSIMDQEQHWHDRPIIQNKLASGALERMFT